ncbi:hydroxymethylpyrimidine/phosphomethylpyrimidine kinase/thiaminase (transcriptional activator TenA)/hydroxymethylpyrimidine kinase / phosphomethylpyrimidine kinase / thiamine-phosphate diphosphorylase [Limimonas halophila]|uniref:Hydroxymethylpyrimidine/phosphomethylpyrimidine kinase/thiaminase (Transcriptional activator TenA)/hydroxymethylpyrimidine kinase / phosphomethylpyrimidine kinase / thiamine-phosphate diphosphorylase n=1 Tax=Limimonas halophila TaxID=1082479 RepID=A0A1G7QSS7_9PROT|nr:TenA family protein [Limimonas halophila]SDG01578.1 hydroxymethylpyrimidine/phosphomethylpyrimidine kinase/thiaminase (transcriptional activator TenA)/hydroxymethylpyrimidine kinase / phosphomethylpyrimidine kinase / thiamine-phosphate diphosphorylase [Limimonas halophila]
MSWIEEVCAAHADQLQHCVAHPALDQLFASRLPRDRFLVYLHQDLVYLREEAKVLAHAASKARSLDAASRIARLVREVNAEESLRHQTLATHLGQPVDPLAVTPAPATHAYVSHLRSVAFDGGLLEILAALYPSPWLYTCVGRHFADSEPADPLVRNLLDYYRGDSLPRSVATLGALIDDAGAEADQVARLSACRAFAVSLHHQRRFLDMVLTGDAWAFETPQDAGDG